MIFRRPFPSLVRWRALPALWLVAALLWAPIWGQWHGIAHQLRQTLAGPSVAASVQTVQTVQSAGDTDEGHSAGSALCQVLDHLGHASALSAWPVQLAALTWPAFWPAEAVSAEPVARACWTPQARAPPHWI